MNILQAFILGIVQGLTEFFPVSSSGHLALLQNFFGEVDVSFDIMLHLATLLAVVAFFWKDLLTLARDFFTFKKESENFRLAVFLIIATIPAGIFGFLIKDYIETIFSSLIYVAIGFFISGIFLFFASYSKEKRELNLKNSIFIGLAQALAIFPGISRSGATISTGTLLGVSREKAIRFSFLLSIPVILGASLLKIGEISSLSLEIAVIGFISAFISGLFAIVIFMRYVKIKNFRYFAYYCWILALLIFIFYFLL